MDTATSKSLGVDTAMSKSLGVDTTTARRGYSDASFLLHRILHKKVRNVENLHGKICAFVLVKDPRGMHGLTCAQLTHELLRAFSGLIAITNII